MTATFASIPTLGNYLVSGYWQPRHWASNSVSVNITGLTAGEQILAISALNAWHEVANISFTFTSGAANITYNHNGSSTAVTSDTFSGTSLTSATVDISSNWWPNTNIYSYMYQTYIHETGHALGLGHEGPYDGSATYGVNNIYTNDTWQWSVMSYNSQNNFGGATYDYVITPEMANIYAIQSIYGSTNTRTGDTTYGFNSNAGSLYDFASYAGLGTPAFTIYDSGGINTLDASGYSQNQTIDLTPGHWSSIGGYVNNIGIYLTTTIRKAIGGTGNDLIITNANATLTGGGGNNTFQGTLFGLASCTITDLHAGDKINFTNASLASFTYDWNGTRLTYANGAYLPIMFSNHPNGQFVLSNDSLYGGIDLTFLDPPKIAGTGDFNRDGTSDFIMYQDAGGIRSLYDWGC